MSHDCILVIGASGIIGSEVVNILTSHGQKIRKTTSKTVTNDDTVHLNLCTGEGVKQAFEGITKALLLCPKFYADQYRLLAPLIEQAQQHQLTKVVLMTALGANLIETSPFHRAELALAKTGLPYLIVRPNWFMQNFNSLWLPTIKQQGKILLPAGNAKTSFIDARDIAEVIATLLLTDRFTNNAFDLTGPHALTHQEVAQEISLATGKTITYQEIEAADFKKNLLAAGVQADYCDFLVNIFEFLRHGYNAHLTQEVQHILGREPHSFTQYVHDYKQAWM